MKAVKLTTLTGTGNYCDTGFNKPAASTLECDVQHTLSVLWLILPFDARSTHQSLSRCFHCGLTQKTSRAGVLYAHRNGAGVCHPLETAGKNMMLK